MITGVQALPVSALIGSNPGNNHVARLKLQVVAIYAKVQTDGTHAALHREPCGNKKK